MSATVHGKPLAAMLGGGNPAQIPAVEDVYISTLRQLMENRQATADMFGKYDGPQGNSAFVTTVKNFLNRHYNLGIEEDNIAVVAGSQTGYFLLFNILAGRHNGLKKRILFPMTPEYIGYGDQAIERDEFTSARPKIVKLGDHEFEYQVDFEYLTIDQEIAAICLSRPCNPTGNVVTDEEISGLANLAKQHDIPLLIDNAYGLPFPGIVKPKINLNWSDHTVFSITLSKIGLPSTRIGIFVGPPELMKVLVQANAVATQSAPGFGQFLVRPLLENDEILDLCERLIQPYYFERAQKARQLIDHYFPTEVPWRLHEHQGSYFFWFWLEGSKMTGFQIHDYLKERGVIVVPGEHFFIGQNSDEWQHAHECFRINFARPDKELEDGIPILAEVVAKAYSS